MTKVVMSFWVGASETGGRQGEKSDCLAEHLDLIAGVSVVCKKLTLRARYLTIEGGGLARKREVVDRCSRRLGVSTPTRAAGRLVKW
jgi:hypothetical protein